MTSKKVFTVSDINQYIKALINMDYILNNIWVRGEISNFKKHISGHIYFTLKDENSAISCVMFRSSAASLNFQPKSGMGVMVGGAVSVYEKTGQCQIYVNKMEKEGRGALYEAFERLKKALEEEGLFSQKREIPSFPKCIGIITSPTGAAIRDIIQISKRRNPSISLVVYPAIVQGEEAPKSIADAIHAMNEWGKADVLIVGRGGGSIEDLWAFNEEIVARAIYESQIPTISAVGHETDFTIADFVSDLRAPTPSAGAEIAVPLKDDYISRISYVNKVLNQSIEDKLYDGINRIKEIQNRIPFKRPLDFIYKKQQNVDNVEKLLQKEMDDRLKTYRTHLVHQIKTLETLSPLNTLIRGYSIVTGEDGHTVSSINDIQINQEINIRIKDGLVHGQVKGIQKEEEGENA